MVSDAASVTGTAPYLKYSEPARAMRTKSPVAGEGGSLDD